MSGEKQTQHSIVATILGLNRRGLLAKQPWGKELIALSDNVSHIVQCGKFTLEQPKLHLIPKSNSRNSMRCLASYTKMEDRLLLSGAFTYMRDKFDGQLQDCCYAFRRDGELSHQTAIGDLIEYRLDHLGEKLYVAECDIQKFFDVINHDIVLAAYDFFARESEPDPRLRMILEAYLASYSSTRNLAESTDEAVVRDRHLVKPVAATGVGDFYPGKNVDDLEIGIPQGGTLSPLIANIVLDAVDRAVISTNDPDLFYARFCDDMIIVHPNRKKCQEALDRYMKALEILKLPVHKLKKKPELGDEYYDECKSKGPFLWTGGENAPKSAIPWVAFLGVHIGFDAQVRIRKSSLEKHIDNLRKEKALFLRVIGNKNSGFRKGVKVEDAITAFERRLVSMGVGFDITGTDPDGNLCWMAAFPKITRDKFAKNQMRKLDHAREAIALSVRKKLCENEVKKMQIAGLDKAMIPLPKIYFGRPFSYYGYLMNVNRTAAFPAELPSDYSAYSTW